MCPTDLLSPAGLWVALEGGDDGNGACLLSESSKGPPPLGEGRVTLEEEDDEDDEDDEPSSGENGGIPGGRPTSLGSPAAFLPVVVGAKVVHLHRRTREGLVVTPVPRLEELGYQLVSVGRPPLLARIFSLVSVEDHSSALRALPPVKLG